jgi:hypothetical protein
MTICTENWLFKGFSTIKGKTVLVLKHCPVQTHARSSDKDPESVVTGWR